MFVGCASVKPVVCSRQGTSIRQSTACAVYKYMLHQGQGSSRCDSCYIADSEPTNGSHPAWPPRGRPGHHRLPSTGHCTDQVGQRTITQQHAKGMLVRVGIMAQRNNLMFQHTKYANPDGLDAIIAAGTSHVRSTDC
jgi:hypothetical protein